MGIIEFPIFTGDDLRQWISWLEDFFVRENFTADEKMNLAQSLLDGEAEAWFYSSQKRFLFQSWEHLMDLLIWRFGDFSDPELFLLWDKNDRLLQKQRVDAKIRRMKTTSIPEKDSIQVPVSSLEPSLKFSSEPLVVSEAWQSAMVSNNRVQSQSGFDCVKHKTNAYQVFDKTSPHKERLKPKTKRKLSLSPKTWMFKFKNKNLQRQYSCSRATFGYKWKEHNSRYWRRIRQTHLSRLLCISQTNAEKALEALKKIQFQQATVMCDGTKVPSLSAKELVPGDIVELRDGDKVPADMRVLVLISSTLGVEQGSLTGECEAVSNTTKPVDVNADIQGKKCMVFAGTTGICSDNTGTLTTNQMAVSKLVARGSRTGTLRSDQLWSELEQRIATLEFDSDRKSMGVLVDSSSGNKFLLVKGAVENVLDRSTRIQLLAGSVQELDQYSRDLINTRIFQGRWCMNLPGQLKSLSIWHRWRRKD